MPATRPTESTEYIRHSFTSDERLTMGDELAQAHNRMEDIDNEEAVIRAQIKEKRSQVEATISRVSRELANGFTMMNVRCRLEYDQPNPNEVSYVRVDNGDVVKTRAFTEAERQQDLPLGDGTISVEVIPPEKSAENVAEFFAGNGEAKTPAPEDDAEEKRKRKRSDESKAVAKAKENLTLM